MCFAKISKIIIIAKEILSHCLKRQIAFLKRRVRYLKSKGMINYNSRPRMQQSKKLSFLFVINE